MELCPPVLPSQTFFALLACTGLWNTRATRGFKIHKSVLRHVPKNICWEKVHGPQKSVRHGLDLPKIRLDSAGIGNDSNAFQLQCASWMFILAPTIEAVEQSDPWQSCLLLDPLPANGA